MSVGAICSAPAPRGDVISELYPAALIHSLPGISCQLIAHAGIRIGANVAATNVVDAERIRRGVAVEVVVAGGAKIRILSVGTVIRGIWRHLSIGAVGRDPSVSPVGRDLSVGTIVALPRTILSVSRRAY